MSKERAAMLAAKLRRERDDNEDTDDSAILCIETEIVTVGELLDLLDEHAGAIT